MKKFSILSTLFIAFTMLFSCAYSLTSEQSTAILKKKALTCSSYIHNVQDDSVIYQIVGRYNRKCVVRAFTTDSKMECNLDKHDLLLFSLTIPYKKQIVQDLSQNPTPQPYEFTNDYDYFLKSGSCAIKQ